MKKGNGILFKIYVKHLKDYKSRIFFSKYLLYSFNFSNLMIKIHKFFYINKIQYVFLHDN